MGVCKWDFFEQKCSWFGFIQTWISKIVSDLREVCNFSLLMKPFSNSCELCLVLYSCTFQLISNPYQHQRLKQWAMFATSSEWLYCQMKNKCPLWVKLLPGCTNIVWKCKMWFCWSLAVSVDVGLCTNWASTCLRTCVTDSCAGCYKGLYSLQGCCEVYGFCQNLLWRWIY